MTPIQLRNKQFEDRYFSALRLWKEALKNLDKYDEQSLRFLWKRLEDDFKSVGYIFGDRESDK